MRIAVVGGGPAGSRAAEILAARGARVVLYEPRPEWEKPCGGGIPERGIDSWPFLKADHLPQRRCLRARIYSPSGREAVVPLREPLRVFSRRDLNRFLRERAERRGVEVRSVRVAGLRSHLGNWEVRDEEDRTDRFEFLVGADGASGTVRGRVAPHLAPLEQALGIGYYLEGFTSEEIVLKFFPGLDGYLWIFPRPDHLAVGICGPTGAGQGGELLRHLEGFLVDLHGAAVLRRLRRYAARIPSPAPGPLRPEACLGRGWALIGDAAGWVDPLTREGIHYAIASGEILSVSLSEARPEAYPERWDRMFGAELGWVQSHRKLFYSPRFLEAFALLARSSPAVVEVISDLVAGRQSYQTLFPRLSRMSPTVAVHLVQDRLRTLLHRSPVRPAARLTPIPFGESGRAADPDRRSGFG